MVAKISLLRDRFNSGCALLRTPNDDPLVAVVGGTKATGVDLWNLATNDVWPGNDYYPKSEFIPDARPVAFSVYGGSDMIVAISSTFQLYAKLLRYNVYSNRWTEISPISYRENIAVVPAEKRWSYCAPILFG